MVIIGTITLDRDCAAVGTGRRYAGRLLTRGNVDLDALRLVVSELLTNAVRHGAGTHMSLLLGQERPGADRIRVEVRDAGHPGRLPSCRDQVEPTDERGRGLLLVSAVATDWGVRREPGRTTVWAELAWKPCDHLYGK